MGKKIKKSLYIAFCMILCFSFCTGCGKRNRNGSKQSDDGRSYGGLIALEQEDTAHTAFFDLTVDSAKKYDTYQFADGLYQAEDGMVYVLVTITVKNTYAQKLSMGITDFTLNYDENDKKNIIYGYGKTNIDQQDMMEDTYTLQKGESITKSILYIVPEKEHYYLDYTEFYSDDFEGDSFKIRFSPKKSIPITTEESTGSTAENTAVTEVE